MTEKEMQRIVMRGILNMPDNSSYSRVERWNRYCSQHGFKLIMFKREIDIISVTTDVIFPFAVPFAVRGIEEYYDEIDRTLKRSIS